MLKKHIHKFVYPLPNGPVSIGKCKCGEEKPGFNSIEGMYKFNNRFTKKGFLNNFNKK